MTFIIKTSFPIGSASLGLALYLMARRGNVRQQQVRLVFVAGIDIVLGFFHVVKMKIMVALLLIF